MSTERLFRRVIAAMALSVVVLSTSVFAHDPIILTDAQTTPDAGPLLPDGTISFALYGTLGAPGDSRGVRVQLAEGDSLDLSLLVPALEPEQSLVDGALPMLSVVRPDGSPEFLRPAQRVRFDEPFSGTSYVRLLEFREPAQAGTYRLVVTGEAPARFTLAFGTVEQFGTPVENVVDRDQGTKGVEQWYARPAPAPAPEAAPAANTMSSTTLPIIPVAADSTVAASTSTSGPFVTAVPQSAGVDGTAGSAVFIGAVLIVLAGVGFLVWSKRRNG